MSAMKEAFDEMTATEREQADLDEAVALMQMRGAQAPGAVTVHWILYDDGTTGKIETTGPELGELAKPGREVTFTEYDERLTELRAVSDDYLAELQAADLARLKGDYDALIALGLPEDTARRMSGYNPEAG